MRLHCKLGSKNCTPKSNEYQIPNFCAEFNNDLIVIQDTVHIGAKLRTRLLNPSIILPVGNYSIPANHLQTLINTISKDKHCLNLKDISSKDKMNYKSVEKISDDKVISLLKNQIPGSNAIVLYLKIINLFTNAFLNKTLQPLTRIYDVWYCIFILRFWRVWLHDSKYSITDNFITLNAYICMEINAHGLTNIILN